MMTSWWHDKTLLSCARTFTIARWILWKLSPVIKAQEKIEDYYEHSLLDSGITKKSVAVIISFIIVDLSFVLFFGGKATQMRWALGLKHLEWRRLVKAKRVTYSCQKASYQHEERPSPPWRRSMRNHAKLSGGHGLYSMHQSLVKWKWR